MPLNNTQRSINRIFMKPSCWMAFCAYLLHIEFTKIGQETREVRVEIHLHPQVKYVIVLVFTKPMLVQRFVKNSYTEILWKSDSLFAHTRPQIVSWTCCHIQRVFYTSNRTPNNWSNNYYDSTSRLPHMYVQLYVPLYCIT
jgi:hypothetical protein